MFHPQCAGISPTERKIVPTILPKSLNATILAIDTNFLACSFPNVVLINCYFPTDYHDNISFDAFTRCCFNINRFISSLQSNFRTYI